MNDLNFLLRRLNQPNANASHLEDAATATLAGLVALIALASLL